MKIKKTAMIISTLLLVVITITLTLLLSDESKMKELAATFKITDGSNFKTYSNESVSVSIADPHVLKASNGTFYMYGTTGGPGYRAYSSTDLVNWKDVGYAFFSGNAKWAGGTYWAPEVVEKNNKYYMYYSANLSRSKTMRIGVAVSDKPEGPFRDAYDKPLIDFGYAVIDANVLLDDDGRVYLYYSRDCSENVYKGHHESHIYGVELNDDMISLKGEPVKLLGPDSLWEIDSGDWRWNEAPFCFKKNGVYYLMYSANFFDSRSYAVGYATSKHPLKDFVKAPENPVLTYKTYPDKVSGSGHNSVIDTENGMYIAYHRHTDAEAGAGPRKYSIDQMGIREDGSLYVNGPSIYRQPIPEVGSEYKNAALNATLKVSSTKPGYNNKGAIDREIVLDKRFEMYEWVADPSDNFPSISLTFKKPEKAHAILVYGSSKDTRKKIKIDLTINGAIRIKDIVISPNNGEPSLITFQELEINDLKFDFRGIDGNGEIGISEISVVSRK